MTQLTPGSPSRPPSARLKLRLFSHNIRYATNTPSHNERPWPERLPLILNQFAYHTRCLQIPAGPHSSDYDDSNISTAFICLQEVLHSQLVDVLASLNRHTLSDQEGQNPDIPSGPIWSHIGVGRDDGKQAGEYSPIIYPVQMFDVLHSETVWLSSTPDRPSKDWGAGCIRMVTVGVFEQKHTRKRVMVCNTHLDNVSALARENGVKVILKTIRRVREEWSCSHNDSEVATLEAAEDLPIVLTGDFNAFDSDKAYLTMANSHLMADVQCLVSRQDRYGDEKTFTSWGPDREKSEQGRIDFIWLGDKHRIVSGPPETQESEEHDDGNHTELGLMVKGYAVLPNVWDEGVYCSDHRCVVADLEIRYP